MGDETGVVMYSTAWCPYCERARALLERKGAAFREIKVDEDPAERQAMLARSGGRRTVPQIFIGDRHVGGFDDLYALDKSGELDRLLGHA
ncbi:MAG: glutaredoxin 3 [Gammaproteobacteria bacterium]|nr:glutaredoxin 3 [Gammaproteobacteria bacterium]